MKPRLILKKPRILPARLPAPRRPRVGQVRPDHSSVFFNVMLSSCLRVEPEGDTEEQEDTEEQDEEKMKTSDEVECASHHPSTVLHP